MELPYVKFGVISPGRHFINRVYPAMETLNFEVNAFFSRKGTLKGELSAISGSAVTDDITRFTTGDFDSVYISSPNSLHYHDAVACLEAGKHVLLEKPMTLKFAEAEKLVELARKKELKLAVGFHLRFHPALIEIRDMIACEKIDPSGIAYITAEWGGYRDRHGREGTWWGVEEMAGGGSMVGTGVHVLDSLNFVTGRRPVEIFAMRFPDIILEYTTSILARFDEFPAYATVSGGVQFPENSLRILTGEDTIEVSDLYGTEIKGALRRNGRVLKRYPKRSIYLEELKGFRDFVDGKESSIATGEEGAFVTKEMEAVHRSARDRNAVRL